MKEGAIKILGVTLISLGILGFLLLGTNILGFAISEETEATLTFSEMQDLTLKIGDTQSIPINIKNTGPEELTNCALLVSGEKSGWTSSEETKNIAADSNIDFNLEISIPENTPVENYPITLQLTCDQETTSQQTSISVTKGVDAIKIREMKSEKNLLNIIYTFDNEGFIGDTTYVEMWVNNPDGFEINRIQDDFSIKTDNLIVREVKIDLKENPKGVYAVFFSHPSDSEDYIKKSIILGKSATTGNAVFNIAKGKGMPYLGFLLFIAVGIFFIFRSHRRSVQKVNEPISTSPKLRPIK
tara:strand:+ start:286 stop:1182 length:897 start_codon:yes stop_codon:yes gene_type:complete